MEKETLKKYILIYGYGRWSKIRKISASSCQILKDKPDAEMKAYANDFLRTLFENVQTEKNELKSFLMTLLESDSENSHFVKCPTRHWGDIQ